MISCLTPKGMHRSREVENWARSMSKSRPHQGVCLGNTCVMGYFTVRAVVGSAEKCPEGREDAEERKAWCTGALRLVHWSK